MTEQDAINEEPRTHTYSPSSSNLPISHSDVGISSVRDTDDKKGFKLFDSTNETKRAMKSRHLTMIGMYPSNSGTIVV